MLKLTLRPFLVFHFHHLQSLIYIVSQHAALSKRDDPLEYQQPRSIRQVNILSQNRYNMFKILPHDHVQLNKHFVYEYATNLKLILRIKL